MDEPLIILGRVANFEERIDRQADGALVFDVSLGKVANFKLRTDGRLLEKVWWTDVGVFILEVIESESGRFTGRLYWCAGTASIALDTREAARDWVEQEAKRRAREMVELAK